MGPVVAAGNLRYRLDGNFGWLALRSQTWHALLPHLGGGVPSHRGIHGSDLNR